MARVARLMGSTAKEITEIPYELLSFRLIDGTIHGPRLVLTDCDGKLRYQLAPGESVVHVDEAFIDMLSEHCWNGRILYEREMLENLQKSIQLHGFSTDHPPMYLVWDGAYLYPWDGHRRALATFLLNQKGVPVPSVYGVLQSLGSGKGVKTEEDFLIQMIVTDEEKAYFTFADKLNLYRRLRKLFIDEHGSDKGFHEHLKTRTRWSIHQIDNLERLQIFPLQFLKEVCEAKIAETTLLDLTKPQYDPLGLAKKQKLISELIKEAKASGVRLTREIVNSRLRREVDQLYLSPNDTNNSDPSTSDGESSGSFAEDPRLLNEESAALPKPPALPIAPQTATPQLAAKRSGSGSSITVGGTLAKSNTTAQTTGTGNQQINPATQPPAPKNEPLKPKPTTTEITKLFLQFLLESEAVVQDDSVYVTVPRKLWDQAMEAAELRQKYKK